MMRIRSKLAPSPIQGVGCFAEEPIAKGGLVWKFDPGLDRELALEEIQLFPPVIRDFLHSYSWASPSKTILLCCDHGGYFNHEDNANTAMTPDGYACLATRDIAAGDELTTNYKELPDIDRAEGGPSLPAFHAVAAADHIEIRVEGGSVAAPWSIPIGSLRDRTEAEEIAKNLNALAKRQIVRVEQLAPACQDNARC